MQSSEMINVEHVFYANVTNTYWCKLLCSQEIQVKLYSDAPEL